MDNVKTRRRFLALSLGVAVDFAARAFGLYPYNLPASGVAHAADGSTLENLQAAHAREKQCATAFAAYAKKADAEGYGRLASLFRAGARSKEVQAANLLGALKKSGGSPATSSSPPVHVKNTADNLADALGRLAEGRDDLFPSYLKKAKDERNTDAMRAFNYSRTGDDSVFKLLEPAKAALDKWKGGARNYFVCPTCSQVVVKVDFLKCVVCYTLGEKYVKVS